MRNNAITVASPGLRLPAALLMCFIVSVAGAADQVLSMQINVTKGDNAFNDVKNRRGQDLEVEILDQNLRPVQGAQVVFRLPFAGAGGTFTGGQITFSTTTDAMGHAATEGLRPNATEGRFNISIQASFNGMEARKTVAQTNTVAGGQIGPGIKSHKKYWIIALIGGAAAGGVVVATHHGSSSSAGAPPTSLSAGTITIGGPSQ
jgi:hypothetical protein